MQKYSSSYSEQLQDLKEQNDYISSQNEDNIKLLESFQLKVGESFDSFCIRDEEVLREETCPSEDKLREILLSYESQLFEANSLNKKLEFRNYML
jgi:hypothetical protein